MRSTWMFLGLAVLALFAGVGSKPTFGGLVATATSRVQMSVDSLDQHVTVTVPETGGALNLNNVSRALQSLSVRAVDPADGVTARFESSGTDHASLAPGATDGVELVDSSGQATTGKVAVGVERFDGTLFPSGVFSTAAPNPPSP